MRIFVASWFFPPISTSEGNVTYKLLRNSRHDYVVCSSLSDRWTYKAEFEIAADNIELFSINTDSFDEWIQSGLEIFAREHKKHPFDAFMTRAMPPESIDFGMRLKELYPDIPWISSLADPIAKSPYDIKVWIDDAKGLTDNEKELFRKSLVLGCQGWANHHNYGVRKMVENKDIEDKAITKADILIFPSEITRSYILASRKPKCALVVPHSFDRTLLPSQKAELLNDGNGEQTQEITLAFLGFSDGLRSLEPLVEAIHVLKNSNEYVLDNLKVRFIGNIPERIRSIVFNYYLQDVISIEPGVNYLQSLQIMSEADWLIHVDAVFEHLDSYGGSVYFAAKIADYMATDKPILALTGNGSYASSIVREAGGICVDPRNVVAISQFLIELANGRIDPRINRAYRDMFEAKVIAGKYDDDIEAYIVGNKNPSFSHRSSWPKVLAAPKHAEKLITICVPAYNVSAYLDRCLYSMLSCKNVSQLEIIVVNDGSKDNTLEIAQSYANRYPDIVKVVDKENGGHGSTINVGIEQASGKYFRVVDGDDWVDTQNYDKFISRLHSSDIDPDLISSNYYQVYCSDSAMVPWEKVGDWKYYQIYDFSQCDFSKEYFTLASSSIKTELLRRSGFKLQEKTYYVDVEYIMFPIPDIKTVVFTPEHVYRYAVGNAEQSINFDVFVSRYDDHDRVIRRMIRFYEDEHNEAAAGQQNYMAALLTKHLIKNHYGICLVMDIDSERSSQRAREFDGFFRQTSPELYQKFHKMHKVYRRAKRHNFNPSYIKRISMWEIPTLKQKLHNSYANLRYGSVGQKLSRNGLARKVYYSLKDMRDKARKGTND